MQVWHKVQVQRPLDNRWAAIGVASFCLGILLLTIALLEGCSGGQCAYDARFDGREPDPAGGVYPYYLVAECPGQPTATIIESATRLHVPR